MLVVVLLRFFEYWPTGGPIRIGAKGLTRLMPIIFPTDVIILNLDAVNLMHRACGSTENAVKAWGLITCLRLRC